MAGNVESSDLASALAADQAAQTSLESTIQNVNSNPGYSGAPPNNQGLKAIGDVLGGISSFASTGAGKVAGFAGSAASGLGSLLDPAKARLSLAGLLGKTKSTQTKAPATWVSAGVGMSTAAEADWRVKVSVAPGSAILYDLDSNVLMTPIFDTGGVIFPITPTIQMSHTAKYSAQSLTHSNYAMQFYEGSEVAAINLNGEFTVQNIEEGQYLLAVIYFFRASTKMYWGSDDWAGSPPPMVFLTGFGSHYFPNVPCVVTSFLHTMPDDKDYIEVPVLGGERGQTTRLPTQSTIQVVLQPIYSRAAVTEFNLDDFANGNMLTGKAKTNRGFI